MSDTLDRRSPQEKATDALVSAIHRLLVILQKDGLPSIDTNLALRNCLRSLGVNPPSPLFEVEVEVVTVRRERASVPAACPHCGFVFNGEKRAIREIQLDWACQDVALIQGEDPWGTQEHDGNPLVLGYGCGKCGKLLAGTEFYTRVQVAK